MPRTSPAHDLLQPLIVQKLKDGSYGVVDGGRWYAALKLLAADKPAKGFTKAMKVACREMPAEDMAVSGVSYSENAEFRSAWKLSGNGLTALAANSPKQAQRFLAAPAAINVSPSRPVTPRPMLSTSGANMLPECGPDRPRIHPSQPHPGNLAIPVADFPTRRQMFAGRCERALISIHGLSRDQGRGAPEVACALSGMGAEHHWLATISFHAD